MKHLNEHKYVKITKDQNNWYKVVIKETYDTQNIFGKTNINENEIEIPFMFSSPDIAKDFVSILPTNISKINLKSYRCPHCHLCYASYETYKLDVGEFSIYIKWASVSRKTGGFFSDKTYLIPNGNYVDKFVTNVKPVNFRGEYEIVEHEYDKLSNLIKHLKKEKEDSIEEYNYELIEQ